MKKIVTVIALALVCSGAYAQFNQGRILAGGGIGFSAVTNKYDYGTTSGTSSKQTTFSFDPKVGYFVIDNLAVGLELNLASGSTKYDGTDNKDTQTQVAVGPFVRYYLDQGIFFQGAVGFGGASFKEKEGSVTTTTKRGLFSWDIGIGYAYFLNDYVAIEPIFMYGAVSQKNKDNDFKDTASGVALNIGLQVYLGPRN